MPRLKLVLLSIALGAALLGSATTAFHAGKATEYANQVSESVTIGAKPFDSNELVEQAFGKKLNPLHYGILPVLVVMENHRQQSLDLRGIEVTLVGADGTHVGASRAEELFYKGTPKRQPSGAGQVQFPFPLPGSKNKLNGSELQDRSFGVKFLPPGESASGFFYFAARFEPGDSIYIDGLHEEPSHHQLFYFEFPLAESSSPAAAH